MLVDLVAPLRCVGCGEHSDGELCSSCAHRVRVVGAPMCERCGSPRPARCCEELKGFGRARSLVFFAEPARSLTLALKRRGRRGLVRHIGALVADLVRKERLEGDVVVYVPSGRAADVKGFDHGELLARAVGTFLEVRVAPLLVRTKDGPRQSDVGLERRRENVRDRFEGRPFGGRVLLVDDVFTTGATVEACAVALRSAGAESVDVATWARTERLRS